MIALAQGNHHTGASHTYIIAPPTANQYQYPRDSTPGELFWIKADNVIEVCCVIFLVAGQSLSRSRVCSFYGKFLREV